MKKTTELKMTFPTITQCLDWVQKELQTGVFVPDTFSNASVVISNHDRFGYKDDGSPHNIENRIIVYYYEVTLTFSEDL